MSLDIWSQFVPGLASRSPSIWLQSDPLMQFPGRGGHYGERGNQVTHNPKETKSTKEQLYANKLDKQGEIDKFLGRHKNTNAESRQNRKSEQTNNK